MRVVDNLQVDMALVDLQALDNKERLLVQALDWSEIEVLIDSLQESLAVDFCLQLNCWH